jgi:hypothetical protein
MRRPILLAGLSLLLAASAPVTAAAQMSGNGFLFRNPRGTITFRGGVSLPQARSEVFDFSFDELTLGREDFAGGSAGFDVARAISARIDLLVSAGFEGRRARSEFRDWVDQNDQPIEQFTDFYRVPVTLGFKAYLRPRGRAIGRFAWVPRRFAPYLGLTGGAIWYRFRQRGDFIDFNTLNVFFDEFESSGWAPVVQGLAGLDLSLTPRFVLNSEVRYTAARAEMSLDFTGFDRIDLSGLSGTIGFGFRF